MSKQSGKSEVLVISGPGFSDQGDLLQQLRFNQNVRLTVFNVGAGLTQHLIDETKRADLVLLRGPWTATPEDMLYASLLAERLKPSFDILRQRSQDNNPARVVGIGRGGLIVLQSTLEGAQDFARVEWTGEVKELGPWASVRLSGVKAEIYGLLQGRALPKISAANQGNFQPWITMTSGQVSGWKISPSVFVSFVDLLALADRSQLADYGYVDLSGVSTQSDVLGMMLSGQAFPD